MPLGLPPNADVLAAGFPHADPPVGPNTVVYRLFRPADPETGEDRSPFYFSSVPTTDHVGGGRFDLVSPNGACYFAGSPLDAALEVLRSPGLVDPVDANRCVAEVVPSRELVAAQANVREARKFGVTLELFATPDYEMPRRWAAALFDAGFQSLLGTCSHDPSSAGVAVTFFDAEGEHLPCGAEWSVEVSALWADPELMDDLHRCGIEFRFPPTSVDFVDP